MSTEYKVSVNCLAFNHEKYIRKTFEGFVSQKTNFKFKVIVHDDASTDNTQEIIREYAEKYPDIIFPIYQTQNQYSKGVKIFDEILAPLCDTEFLAVCEGDDYWTDPEKLQLQYDFMVSHPEYSMCIHNTKRINEKGEDIGQNVNSCTEDRDFEANEIIAVGGGGLYQSSSVFCRTADRIKMPGEFRLPGIGDYPLAIYMATLGKIHYISRVMSAYRVGSLNGWTQRVAHNRQKFNVHLEKMIEYLNRLNAHLDYNYKCGFELALAKYQYDFWLNNHLIWHILFNKNTRGHFVRSNSPKKRAKMIIKESAKLVLEKLGLRK